MAVTAIGWFHVEWPYYVIFIGSDLENAIIFEFLLYLLPNAAEKQVSKGVKTWDCLSIVFQRFEVH
jgi:hypothetical protein